MSETVLEVILRNCERFADKIALHWLNKECEVVHELSYRDLERNTRKLGKRLLDIYAAKGQRAVLCYPPGLHFIEVFIACLRAGVIAVPVSPPNPYQSAYTIETLIRIVCDSGAHCVLTNDQFIQEIDHHQLESLKQGSLVPWYSTTTALSTHAHKEREGCKDSHGVVCTCAQEKLDTALLEDVALLQYTSGSTGFPKGVMPTHANLLHNLKLMGTVMQTDESMVEVSFLPHFHDMGLICSYLQPLYSGGTGYFMSPVTFVENPGIWIEAFSRYKGTHSKAPNFAFELVLRKGFPGNIDLGSVRYITDGSEPVYTETITRFESTLAPYGLKKNSIRVGYGLAEHTVFMCGAQDEDPVTVNGRISCGRPTMGVTVKIVDPETHTEVPEGIEAEIWVHSESKAIGYWEKEDESQRIFEAQLVNDTSKSYLRTGDLGFMKRGQLFVSGRRKDLIVIHGRNIHPTDVESRIESQLDAVRAGRSAAFEYEYTNTSLQDAIPTRGVGFVAEIRFPEQHTPSDLHLLAEQVVATITLDFQVEVPVVVFIRPRTMPRTTSGKRQRLLCKKQLIAGLLSEIYHWSKFKTPPHLDATLRVTKPCTPILPSILEPESELEKCSDDFPASPNTPNVVSLHSQRKTTKLPSVTTKSPSVASEKSRKEVTPSKSAKRRSSLDTLTATVSTILGVTLQPHSNIWAYGCNSVKAVQISQLLQAEFGFVVEPHLLFTHQTPKALLEKLTRNLLSAQSPEKKEKEKSQGKGVRLQSLPAPQPQLRRLFKDGPQPTPSSKHRNEDIAIVGMACCFAGCDCPASLWNLMINKEVATTSIYNPTTGQTIHGAFVKDTSTFDYNWFGISEWEASIMDPQQSLLLHQTWECLQSAGYGSHESLDRIRGSDFGVFVGVCSSDARVLGQSRKPLPLGTSFVSSIAANRVSHTFGFTGPSVAIDTACAASLSALHAACTSLRLKECSASLVGGVNVLLDPNGTALLANMGMLSPDGECRVFDASANGYVRGEGCGMVLLMPVSRARKDGRRILAVIKSTTTNHNGTSATLTSPSGTAQKKLLQKSLNIAGLRPKDIAYLEAHGTGTVLGDPIEVDAIEEVFGSQSEEEGRSFPLVLGSVKANIGHLETGAGIAGLIKTVLVLEHAKAPGNACLQTINPAFSYSHSLINIPHDAVSLETGCHGDYNLLCAGVSSFGFGGTNVNAILQQYSQLPHMAGVECSVLFAPSKLVHETRREDLAQFLSSMLASLCSMLASFEHAYQSCQDCITRALKGYANTATKKSSLEHLDLSTVLQQPEVLEFLIFYGVVVTLQVHRVKISMIGGLDLCGELVALAFSGVLGLSDVMRLLLHGIAPDRCSIYALPSAGSIALPPTMPLFSHTLGKVCSPHVSEFGNDYLLNLISNLRKGKLQQTTPQDDGTTFLPPSFHPGVCVSLCPETATTFLKSKTSNTIFITFRDESYSPAEYFREKCLELRRLSDRLALESCENKPSSNVKMPAFYERYPLRALVDGIHLPDSEAYYMPETISDETHLSHKRQLNETELKESDNASIMREESGYITQSASTELVELPLPSQQEISKTEISLPFPKSASRMEQAKQKIISDLFSLVKKDLENPDMPVGKVATMGFFAMGLDSLNMMEIRDYMFRNYEVSLNYSDLMELETIEAMAEAVMEANPSMMMKLNIKCGEQEEEASIQPSDSQVGTTVVLQALLKLVENDIEPSDLSLEKFASSGIFQLGLDSLNVMQIADFLRQTYKVDKQFSALIECETLGEIAEMVTQETPVLEAEEEESKSISETTEMASIYPAISPNVMKGNSSPLGEMAATGMAAAPPLVLTKEGYYTLPSTAEIAKLSLKDLEMVHNFTVGHRGVGKVTFLGTSNISELNLDQLVHIEPQHIRLDPNQPKSDNLNKPALIFFENIHPLEKTESGYKILERALKHVCENLMVPAQFVNYDAESREFVMKVNHFY